MDTKVYELVIEADTNDADYITSTTEVTMDQIEKFKPIIEAIKNNKGSHNWPAHEGVRKTVEDEYPELDEELLDEFQDLVPNGEYGVHTISSIVYYPMPIKTVLL